MTTLTENFHAGAFLVSEAMGTRSREAITVLSGQNLKAGAVLGATLAGGAATATAKAGNTGNGTMGAITVSGPAKVGTYRLTIIEPATNAGTFEVEDPDGVVIGTGNVAVAFNAGGLAFTLADGVTDFVAGDGFTIAVTGTAKYKEFNVANTDGSEIARAVLWDAVDASAADKSGVAIVRDAEIASAGLVWFTGATAGNKATGKSQLADAGLIARD